MLSQGSFEHSLNAFTAHVSFSSIFWVSYSCDNPKLWHLVKVRGSSLWLRRKHSPPSQTSAFHSFHESFSLLAQHPNLFFQVIIHWINPPPPPSTYQTTSHTLFAILSIWTNQFHQFLVTPYNSLLRAFGTLFILLIPNRLLQLSICTTLIPTIEQAWWMPYSASFHTQAAIS